MQSAASARSTRCSILVILRQTFLIVVMMGSSMAQASDVYEQADIYRTLRDQALSLDSEEVPSRNGIRALLMEIGYDDAAVTILAFSDGTASMYFSHGGGLIGAGEYEPVREVVFETLSAVGRSLESLDHTDAFPLPDPGRTRFYAVTDNGVLTAEASEESLGNDEHELSPLFFQVHKLIAAMRVARERHDSQGSE